MLHKNFPPTVQAVIFDLDGVLVDTAVYHFQAWRSLAQELGIDFSETQNEQLKGVSRLASLRKILEWGNMQVSEQEFQRLAERKNNSYLALIEQMQAEEILPGTIEFLQLLQGQGIKIGLGSASKNARSILEKTQLTPYFDAIVDGNAVQQSKPHPEVFLRAAAQLGVLAASCLVFEDAQAGVEAARAAGMYVAGVNGKSALRDCDFYVRDLSEMCKG